MQAFNVTIKGSTFVGLLVSVAVFSAGIFSLGKFQGSLFESHNYAKNYTEATNFAQRKIEELRSFDVANGFAEYDNLISGSDSVNGKSASYNRVWTITDDPSGKFKEVSISVSWTGQRSSLESVTLTTSVYKTIVEGSGKALQVVMVTPLTPTGSTCSGGSSSDNSDGGGCGGSDDD